MTAPAKLARAAARASVQAMVLSPAVLVLWNDAAVAALDMANEITWPEAFGICLLARALSAGDLIPLLYPDPKPRPKYGARKKKNHGRTKKR